MTICCGKPEGEAEFRCFDTFGPTFLFNEPTCRGTFHGVWIEGESCALYDCNFPPSGPGFPPGAPLGACCDPVDETCNLTVAPALANDCSEENYQGDRISCEASTCLPPPPPDDFGCVQAAPDRDAPNRRTWNRNLCQNMALQPFAANANNQSANGDAKLATTTRVRAIAQSPNGEPCRFHEGAVVVMPNGDAMGLVCGMPDPIDTTMVRYSLASAFVVPDGAAVQELIPPGDAALFGSYRTPLFTEVAYYSHERRCGTIIV